MYTYIYAYRVRSLNSTLNETVAPITWGSEAGSTYILLWIEEPRIHMARDPNIILDILNKRSMMNVPINDMFRMLYNKDLYSMTPHFNKVDSNQIDQLIEKMHKEQHKWKVAPMVDIVLQEVLYILLYRGVYEPYQFNDSNHWCRIGRSVSSALDRVYSNGSHCNFFISYDLTNVIDHMNYTLLLDTLHVIVSDNRIKELLRKKLKYAPISLSYDKTYSNTPIGNNLDCLLTNIYLTPLDRYIDDMIGNSNSCYTRYGNQLVITYSGNFKDVISLVNEITMWIENHYGILITEDQHKVYKVDDKKHQIRFLEYNLLMVESNNGRRYVGFYMPDNVMRAFIKPYMKNQKPIHISNRIYKPIYEIIRLFREDFERFAQYYSFAKNQRDLGTVKWILQTSMLKTIAAKLKSTCNKVAKKYGSTKVIDGQTYSIISDTKPNGKVEYFGAHPLKTQYNFSNTIIMDSKSKYSTSGEPDALKGARPVRRGVVTR